MSEIKIGDRVHARFPYFDGVAIGTVTAIERSAGATVYCVLVDEAETPSRATAAWLVEVTTAENLHAALARCTEERDGARRDCAYWRLLESQHLEWGRRLERERNEATHALSEARIQLHRFLNERNDARKELEGSLAREESLKISREEALVKRDALRVERDEALKRIAELETAIRADGDASNSTLRAFWRVEDERDALAKERAAVAKERDFWRALAGERYWRMQALEAERDALYRRSAQLAELLRAEGDEP